MMSTIRAESMSSNRVYPERIPEENVSYRMLFQSSPNPMWVFDRETLRFLAVNDAAVDHYGYSRAEFLSMTVLDIRPTDEMDRFLTTVDEFSIGQKQAGQWKHIKRNGEPIDVEVASSSIDWNGRAARLVLVQDITLRKKYEQESQSKTEQLHTIAETMTCYLKTGDWREASSRILQGALTQTESEWAIAGIVTEDHHFGVLAQQGLDWYTVDEGETSAPKMIRIDSLPVDHPIARAIFTAQPVRSQGGSESNTVLRNFMVVPVVHGEDVVGVVGVANRKRDYDDEVQRRLEILARTSGILYDIYRRSERENSLHGRLQQLDKIHAIGRLAGGVAHDFNNTLMVINGYSEILLSRLPDDDELKTLVVEIHKAAKLGSCLTQQLLAFSRKQIPQLKTLNFNSVLDEVRHMLQHTVGRRIELVMHLDPGLHNVKADAAQIEQIIMNLSINARDAMPDGGRLLITTSNVVIKPENSDQFPGMMPGQFVELSVEDNGCGMDKAIVDQIFEPFFTTKARGQGTGLGLSNVFRIVQQNCGHIVVNSRPNTGTVFRIYHPQCE
jgi:two-component system cell cycle sensor histidine kinase/response regulator CckA